MGVEQAFNHLPNEYMKWAMQQRLDFLHMMIDHEGEILKLYQEMGERITKKLYSFGGYDFDRRTIEQMFMSLENERKRIEGLLTQSIDSGMSKAATIGIEFELNKTVHMLTEAGLKSELIHKTEQSLIGIHHDALKAMWHRKSYGLKLSERIWNTSKKNKNALSDIILEGMATGRNTAEVGKAIEAYIENNKSVLSTMMEGAELKNVPKNIHFLATRLASTEMVSAYGLASDGAALRSPGTIGMKYQLSNAHPCYDICDVICDADDYGLGRGCYPLEQLPQYPFHPFCLCIKTTLEMDPDELIKKLQNWADDPSSESGIDSWAKNTDGRKIQTFDAEILMRKNGHIKEKSTVTEKTEATKPSKQTNTTVKWDTVHSEKFKAKFKNITDNPKTNQLLYNKSLDILEHRDNTEYEDMYLISKNKSKVVGVQRHSSKRLQIDYNDSLTKAVKKYDDLISIHNHPNSSPPSGGDFASNALRGYKKGVVVCHNGDIWEYSAGKYKENMGKIIDLSIAKYQKRGYTVNESYIEAYNELKNQFTLKWRKLK